MKIELIKGDITEIAVDAIVNAARHFKPSAKSLEKVLFVCFDENNYEIYRELMEE
jgi:O-acetyl-ADP-ribose deacetylase (regulator of RNase III)